MASGQVFLGGLAPTVVACLGFQSGLAKLMSYPIM